MDRLSLLALYLKRGVGPKTIFKVLGEFGTLDEAKKRKDDLVSLVGPSRASLILSATLEDAEREIEKAKKLGVRIVTFLDEDYPERLKDHRDMPLVLYLRGDLSCLKSKTVAVVGTRYPSEDGKAFSFKLGNSLAKVGITVISGGAYGIDTYAHKGALSSGGKAVVILGSGMARPYPRDNVGMFDEAVRKGGAVLSEFPLGTPPNQGNFPARNRVISALSDVVVVVQAPAKSGALITASWALDQGKEVWAVPFSPLDRRAYGSNRLIYDGAKPLYDIEHFIEEISGGKIVEKRKEDIDEVEAFLLETLKEPMHIDEISYRTGMSTPQLYSVILSLQMKGYIRELPGKIYEAV